MDGMRERGGRSATHPAVWAVRRTPARGDARPGGEAQAWRDRGKGRPAKPEAYLTRGPARRPARQACSCVAAAASSASRPRRGRCRRWEDKVPSLCRILPTEASRGGAPNQPTQGCVSTLAAA